MNQKYTVKKTNEITFWYTFIEANAKGEQLKIELTKVTNSGDKNSIQNLWKKHGYTNKVLETHWSLRTYVTDTEGFSFMKYNPTLKEGKMELNFNWVFEATDESREKLIKEVTRLFLSAEGKTATEIKKEKIQDFANKNNVQLLTEIPKGWKKLKDSMTAPFGTVWISNDEPFISGNRKLSLLII